MVKNIFIVFTFLVSVSLVAMEEHIDKKIRCDEIEIAYAVPKLTDIVAKKIYNLQGDNYNIFTMYEFLQALLPAQIAYHVIE